MKGAAINISMELENFMKHMEYLNVEYINNDCYGNFISTMWNDLIQENINLNVIEAKEMITKQLGLDDYINTVWCLISIRLVHDLDININTKNQQKISFYSSAKIID